MNTAAPTASRLVAAAIVLAIVDLVLAALWLQRVDDPRPRPAHADAPTAEPPHDVAPETRARAPAPRALAAAPVAIPAAATAAGSTAVLYGVVRRSSGAALPDFSAIHVGAELRCIVRSDGTFAALGLREGPCEVRTEIPGERPFATMVDVRAPTTRVVIALDDVWLLTVNAVTPEGAPLVEALQKEHPEIRWDAGLDVAGFSEPVATETFACRGASLPSGARTGTADLVGLPRQVVGVLALPPDRNAHVALLLRGAVLAQMPVAPRQAEVTFSLTTNALLARTGTVRVRVVDDGGVPVAGAFVGLNSTNGSGDTHSSDASGRATVQNLMPGMMRLGARHGTRVAAERWILVPSGREIDAGDIVLRPTNEVVFAIEPATQHAALACNLLDPEHNVPGERARHGVTRGEARVRLLDGRHGVFVTNGQECAAIELDTRTLPSQPIRVVLGPGAPLRVDNRVGDGFADVTIRNAAGTIVDDDDYTGLVGKLVCVPPGTYEATITNRRGATKRTVEVGADGGTLIVD
ncbi:MAG: Ig-like domain-containing protein [Planctomycetes bacterium]|nr:Ig-like domain-containing protein [Planctomycetota bacterium]